jgi:hypothetical protein
MIVIFGLLLSVKILLKEESWGRLEQLLWANSLENFEKEIDTIFKGSSLSHWSMK